MLKAAFVSPIKRSAVSKSDLIAITLSAESIGGVGKAVVRVAAWATPVRLSPIA